MSAVRNRRKPANDHRPLSSERMSYVVLTRPRRKLGKFGVVSLVCILVLMFAAWVVGTQFRSPSLNVAVAPAASLVKPVAGEPKPAFYDIVINASEVAPPTSDEVSAVEAVLPAQSVADRPTPHQAAASLEMQDGSDAVEPDTADANDAQDEAGFEAEEAQKLAQEGDARKALSYQHRAAGLAPGNMLYRLQLAILLDQVGDRKGAATLYRQVVDAYVAKDASLPASLGIEDIRRRAEYLTASIDSP